MQQHGDKFPPRSSPLAFPSSPPAPKQVGQKAHAGNRYEHALIEHIQGTNENSGENRAERTSEERRAGKEQKLRRQNQGKARQKGPEYVKPKDSVGSRHYDSDSLDDGDENDGHDANEVNQRPARKIKASGSHDLRDASSEDESSDAGKHSWSPIPNAGERVSP